MSLPDPSTFIARGASAEVFALDAGHVLKLFHAGVDPGTVVREYEIAGEIEQSGLPVPRAVARQDAGERQGIVYTRIYGPTLEAYVRTHPARAGWALRTMAELQARVHACRMPAMRSRTLILATDIEASDLDEALREAAVDRLDQLVEGDALSHGDLHPGNIILTEDGPVLIDWSKAARGAPAADAVRSEMLLRFAPGPREGWAASALRDAAGKWYGHLYRQAGGADRAAMDAWRGLVALAWARQRLPSRDEAFRTYLKRALSVAGLPATRL